jgi:hypothetical protein
MQRNVTFTIKERQPGESVFIAVEYYGPIKGARKVDAYLELSSGADLQRAQEIVRFLQDNITDLRFGRIEP